MRELKVGTAVTISTGPALDKTDGVTPEPGLSPTVNLTKNGTACAARNSATAISHGRDGFYLVPLNAHDLGKATDITGLFQWSGLVCLPTTAPTLVDTTLCCQTDPSTGSYVNCELPIDGACPVEGDYTVVQADCTSYEDPTWVFNIADYVGYLWDLDTTGAYVVQIRFYPIK